MDAGSNGGNGKGMFDWQLTGLAANQADMVYNAERFWGGFPKQVDADKDIFPDWAIGPFAKHPANPVLEPTPEAWDRGRYGGGVHNGSILVLDGEFHYVYRGEQELAPPVAGCDYLCDIGLASSKDGVNFTKDAAHSPFFRRGEDRRFSFEDVCLVRHEDTFYLFCNRWDWLEQNPQVSGTFLSTSPDLRTWTKHGLLFPDAREIHRNPVVLQTPDNQAVRVNGQFVMYLNDGLIAYSDDLIHWTSKKIAAPWPGGENCFAMVDWSEKYADHILLFSGGHHSGHFYAIGEVLLDRRDPEKAIDWLPRPVLHAEPEHPWEDGRCARPPHRRISQFRDCIFFNGLTRHDGQWWLYYGGSEFYTCLAHAPDSTGLASRPRSS